jgi:hypothetical protein
MYFRKPESQRARELPPFDPDKSYTPAQLELYATKFLTEERDEKGLDDGPKWLNTDQQESRQRREIYTAVGTPDPSIVEGIFNRTHPQGRHVNTPEQRKNNAASFYR